MNEPLPSESRQSKANGPLSLSESFPELPNRLLDALNAAVIATNLAGVVTYWNPFAKRLYGWRSEEVLGRNIMEITVGSENEEDAKQHMAAVLAGKTWSGEFQVRCVDGTCVDALVTLSPVRDEAQDIVGIVGVSQDVRSLRELEGALRESEEQFQAFANSLPELCWVARSDGHIFWYSERWYEYTGTTRASMEGWGWQNVHDPELLPTVMERWKLSLETGAPFEMEFPLRGADGVFRWFLTRVKPLRDAQGKITRWYGANTNIDEQRRTLQSLSEARDELEKRVLERTSELHTATESLRELSGRLLRMRDDEQRRLARELHDSVGQLLAAISMNTAAVLSEAGKLSPATAHCVAENAALVEEVSREIRTISHLLHPPLLDEAGLGSALRWYAEEFAKRSRIKLEVDIPSHIERQPNDLEITVFRVVQECLTNIHRHSESAAAAIRIQMRKDEMSLEVEDWGKGVPHEKLEGLSRGGRVGVGFGGMRERLRQLGGRLEVQSTAGGTLVRAVLPVRQTATH